MKHGNMYVSMEEEVRAFMRPFAHSVMVAKSFKGEGEQVDDQQQQQQQETDPFAGIDLDNLPDDAKAALTKAKTEFANLQTKAKTAEATAKANEDLARKHQSRADRFQTTLKQHNLDPDIQRQQQAADPDEAEIEALTQEYVKALGLTPDIAKQYAKMNHIAYKRGKSDILKTVGEAVGPHIQAVGNMSVDRMLNNAANTDEYADILSNADIAEGARTILNGIVATGGPVDKASIDTAIKLAMGEALMSGKFNQQTTTQVQPQQQQTRQFRTLPFNSPPMVRNDGSRGDAAPIAKNEDTAKAVNAVAQAMRRGLPNKK